MISDQLPPLVDEAALERYLDDALPGEGPFEIERHQAGHSNETFFLSRSDHRWVLRRPPRGAFLPTAHDVGREYRVLTALGSTPVRVPRTLLMCTDESVIGAPFYVMERAEGIVVRDRVPDAFGPAERGAIGEELVDALVELHRVDPRAAGLEGFGRPTGYLERQLKRWRGQMELTLPLTRPIPELERVAAWLEAQRPETQATTIVHGDYKLDNVMLAPEPPVRLVAILDWEMSTIGDPLADLGWMVSFWREPDDERGILDDLNWVTAQPGFHPRAALIERYATATGFDLEALDWYIVLAIWKLAVLLEGSYARHLARMTDDPFFARMEDAVPELARRALAVAAV